MALLQDPVAIACRSIIVGNWVDPFVFGFNQQALPQLLCTKIEFYWNESKLVFYLLDKNKTLVQGMIPFKKIAFMQQGSENKSKLIMELKHPPLFYKVTSNEADVREKQCLAPLVAFRSSTVYVVTMASDAMFNKIIPLVKKAGKFFSEPHVVLSQPFPSTVAAFQMEDLSYVVYFQCMVVVSAKLLLEYKINTEFVKELASLEEHVACFYLKSVLAHGEKLYNPTAHIQEWKAKKIYVHKPHLASTHAHIHKVVITPNSTYYEGPFPEMSNRMIRFAKKKYDIDETYFLRLQFANENKEHLGGEQITDEVFNDILKLMHQGVHIQKRHFKFLGFSASQLKEKSCWLFCETNSVSAEQLQHDMGEIFERCVAKYAARFGQNFSTTQDTIELQDVIQIPDIESECGNYMFSDGAGFISKEFADELLCVLGKPFSALQIRYGGAKGTNTNCFLLKNEQEWLQCLPTNCRIK